MSDAPEKKYSNPISGIFTGGSHPTSPKDAQDLQKLVGATVKAGEGALAFASRGSKLGPEARMLTDAMIQTANDVKTGSSTPGIVPPTFPSKS